MRQRLTEDSISRFTRRCRRSGLTRRTAPLTPRLYGSYLYGSYLYGSYLYGSYLYGSYLYGSYLYGSYLYGSYLYGSYLYGSCYARVGALRHSSQYPALAPRNAGPDRCSRSNGLNGEHARDIWTPIQTNLSLTLPLCVDAGRLTYPEYRKNLSSSHDRQQHYPFSSQRPTRRNTTERHVMYDQDRPRRQHGDAHHDHGGQANGEHRVKDPVCGMWVDPHTTEHRAEHDGRPYYFLLGRLPRRSSWPIPRTISIRSMRRRPSPCRRARSTPARCIRRSGRSARAPARSAAWRWSPCSRLPTPVRIAS